MENTDPLPTKRTALRAFADRFLLNSHQAAESDFSVESLEGGFFLIST